MFDDHIIVVSTKRRASTTSDVFYCIDTSAGFAENYPLRKIHTKLPPSVVFSTPGRVLMTSLLAFFTAIRAQTVSLSI